MAKVYDVLILGGGPAGLSAALTLARGGRSVLLFDDQKPRNARAKHMQNFPSHDGTPPQEFKNAVLNDLKKYSTIEFVGSRVEGLKKEKDRFTASTEGAEYFGRRVLLSHGMKDEMLPLEGFKELWGSAIFQCPYCHGHELRNRPMALIGSGPIAKHMLPILRGLTDDLILFTNGGEIEERETIEKNGIKIYDEKITGFERDGETLKAVKLGTQTVERSYLFIKVNQHLSTPLAVALGCTVNDSGFYVIDEMGQTSVKGIFAAGDIVSMRQSVLNACSAGQLAGAALNGELLAEDFRS